MNISKELLKGSTVVLVMSVLRQRETYGYEIIKEIERRSQGVFAFKEGTIYPILHALEAEGLVESYWVTNEETRHRKYYRLTTKGERCWKEKQQEWRLFSATVDMVLGSK